MNLYEMLSIAKRVFTDENWEHTYLKSVNCSGVPSLCTFHDQIVGESKFLSTFCFHKQNCNKF